MGRPFLNLILGSYKTGSFSLRRIKTRSFFHPKKKNGNPTPPAAAAEVVELPKPTLSVAIPCAERMTMKFMPLGSRMDKIVSMDQEGNVLMYDAYQKKLYDCMPRLTGARMRSPIPITVGDALYLIEASPRKTETTDQPDQQHFSFKALIHGDPPDADGVHATLPGWHWHPLPPPPYVEDPRYKLKRGQACGHPSRITSWAVVGDSIWISQEDVGVYAFDMTTREWSRVRDREMPLLGRAEHVPEHDRLFGFRFKYHINNQLFCGTSLDGRTPDTVWEEEAPEEVHPPIGSFGNLRGPSDWHSHHLANLGSGLFCTTRFNRDAAKRFAVFTGVEVDGELNMVKHKSLRYNLDNEEMLHWVF